MSVLTSGSSIFDMILVSCFLTLSALYRLLSLIKFSQNHLFLLTSGSAA